MNPKFIIAVRPGENRGSLRLGMVINHKDLVIGYEKVRGGGWWARDDEKKELILYGSSCDYGSPDFRFMNRMPREFVDYTVIYTPMINLPGNPLDTSEVEWF